MSEQNNTSKRNILIVALVGVVIVVLWMMSRKKKDKNHKKIKESFVDEIERDNDQSVFSLFNYSNNEEIVENYPQTTPMSVLYTDPSGNLASTSDLGLQNLTVNGMSSLNGNVLTKSVFSDSGAQINTDNVMAKGTYGGRLHLMANDIYVMAKNGMRIANDSNGANPYAPATGNLQVDANLSIAGYTNVKSTLDDLYAKIAELKSGLETTNNNLATTNNNLATTNRNLATTNNNLATTNGNLTTTNNNLATTNSDLESNYIKHNSDINLYYPETKGLTDYDMYLGSCNAASCGGGWQASFGRTSGMKTPPNEALFKIRIKKNI